MHIVLIYGTRTQVNLAGLPYIICSITKSCKVPSADQAICL